MEQGYRHLPGHEVSNGNTDAEGTEDILEHDEPCHADTIEEADHAE